MEQPVCITLEDIQWADRASLDLLRHIASRLLRTRVLVVATYRAEETARGALLRNMLPELERAGALRLQLERLSPEAVTRWVMVAVPDEKQAAKMAAQLHRRTGGNPFFIRELMAAAANHDASAIHHDLPYTVHQAIGHRLSLLSPETRTILQTAAVIGERFTYDLLSRAVAASEDGILGALEEAAAVHVIRPADSTGDLFTFDHALVREGFLEGLLGPRLRRIHARVADALAGYPLPDLQALAYHLSRAGDPRAADAMVDSANAALRVGALGPAFDQFQRALNLMGPSDDRRAEVLLKMASCVRFAEPRRAKQLSEQALMLNPHPAIAVWARFRLAQAMWSESDPRAGENAEALYHEEFALLDDPVHRRLQMELLGRWRFWSKRCPLRRPTCTAGR